MITIEINKTFKNQAECDKWKEENLPDCKYKGHVVLCVNQECSVFSDEVKITNIMVIQKNLKK